MSNDPIKDLFTGLGAMAEMFNVTYKEFLKMGYPHDKAVDCTRATLTVMLGMNQNKKEEDNDGK